MGFWSLITGTEDQDVQDARLSAAQAEYLRRLNRRYDEGTLSDEDFQAGQEYVSNLHNEDTDAAAREGFIEGAQEGLNNVLNAPGKLVGGIGDGASQLLGGILKNVPWWVYVLLLVGGFFYLGGGVVLRRWITTRA